MRKISIHVFKRGHTMAYTVNRDHAPDGWLYSRTIECDECPPPQWISASRLLAGLGRDVFYIPSAAA
jgi:hypothetical protein